MELGLSLGNMGDSKNDSSNNNNTHNKVGGFCMGLGRSTAEINSRVIRDGDGDDDEDDQKREKVGSSSSSEGTPPARMTAAPARRQLDLLPFSPVPRPAQPPIRFPWLPDNASSEPGSSDGPGPRPLELNRRDDAEDQSSPNSGTSSFMEFSLGRNAGEGGENNIIGKNNYGQEAMIMGLTMTTTTTSRGSDDDENGLSSSTRKKLRLSKEQSAFLEESFKEHHTLNPKQKLVLAKQLNLRPRQVEVWFQNRRARTKLKQTEVDCEYLKRCCETLTEENRRLQKELQELRALKTSQPFFMHLPATTLTMCPSCERVTPATTTSAAITSPTTATTNTTAAATVTTATTLTLGKPKPMLPFSSNSSSNGQVHHQTAS